jgi:hypothetical protein
MARHCTVCEHLDRSKVELGLANGIAARVLGLRYGLSPDALARHRENHMDSKLLASLKTRHCRSDEELAQIREVESKSLLDEFIWQRAQLYRNGDHAAAIQDWAGHRAAMEAASKVSERIAKLLGELGAAITINHNTINLVQLPQWHVIRTEMVREFRPLGPDAIAACARALAAAEAAFIQQPQREPLLIEATLV